MPLDLSGTCEAFWKNVDDLKTKFLKEGDSEDKARTRAIAAASRTMREHGGKPQDCLGKG